MKSGMYSAPNHSSANVGVTSTPVIAANGARQYLLLVNDSDTAIYVTLGTTATMNSGIRLNAGGGSFEMSALMGNLYQGSISAISSVAGKALLVTEGT